MRLKLSFLFLSGCLLLTACSKETVLSEEEQQEQQLFDQSERLAAKTLFENYYLASKSTGTESAWSGDQASCNPGTTPQATKDKILMRLDYFRKAVGLNNTIAENDTKSSKAQSAALMMKANGVLDHFPSNTWSCYSEAGKEGAGNSLLTQSKNAEAIDSYLRDAGSANGPVGHRRWLLWPKLQEIGIGNTDATNAIWVLGNAGTPPADTPEFIAWPPKGYAPKQLAYPRWSFSIANANFENASIQMKDEKNQSVAVALEALNTQFGDPTIVWVPAINTATLSEDTQYTVTVKNVALNNATEDFEYEVILFDPNN